jgi:hypothetical protein
MNAEPYEPPTLVVLGDVADFVLGSGAHDTADMNTARYW